MYSLALTRGLHGRAARCIWALMSQRGTHEALPQGGFAPGLDSCLLWWSCVVVRQPAPNKSPEVIA